MPQYFIFRDGSGFIVNRQHTWTLVCIVVLYNRSPTVCHVSLFRCMLPHLVTSIPEKMGDILVLSLESTLPLFTCKVTFHKILLLPCNLLWTVFILIPNIFFLDDPWSSSGYSAMLGNSPHIGQPGTFSAINPQDRMVSRNGLNPMLMVDVVVTST